MFWPVMKQSGCSSLETERRGREREGREIETGQSEGQRDGEGKG